MSTLFFPSDEITIYRRRQKAGTNRFDMSATYTAVPADIQPASKERLEMYGGKIGSLFTTYLDLAVDIREGDQVVVTDTGKRYSVRGVQKWQGAGLLDYTEVVLAA